MDHPKKYLVRLSPSPKDPELENLDEVTVEVVGEYDEYDMIKQREEVAHLKVMPLGGMMFMSFQSILPWEYIEEVSGDIGWCGGSLIIKKPGLYFVRLNLSLCTAPDHGSNARVALVDQLGDNVFALPIKDLDNSQSIAIELEPGNYDFVGQVDNGYCNSFGLDEDPSISVTCLSDIFPHIDADIAKAIFSKDSTSSPDKDMPSYEVLRSLLTKVCHEEGLNGAPIVEAGEGIVVHDGFSVPSALRVSVDEEWIDSKIEDRALEFRAEVGTQIANFIMKVEQRLSGQAKNNRTNFDEMEGLIKDVANNLDRHRVRVDERDERFIAIIDDLKKRIEVLENEAANVVEIEPESLTEVLSRVKEDAEGRKKTKEEARLDKLAWPIFDKAKRLHRKGGSYALEWLQEDIVKAHRCKDRKKKSECYKTINLGNKKKRVFSECVCGRSMSPEVMDGVSMEDLISTAVRYAMKKSKWYVGRKYWVQPCGEFVIIRRDRLKSQGEGPRESESDFLKGWA